jgi:hypothetical protein
VIGVAYAIAPTSMSRLLSLGTNDLEYYPSIPELAELDVYRYVNNGHSVAWMAPPSAGGMIRVATMEVGRWIRGMFHRAWLPPEERPPYHTGYEAYSPTLSVVPGLPAVVGWLEHESLPRVHGPHAVCEAWVDALAHAAVLWEGAVSLLAWGAAWVAPELKFLAAAGNAVDRTVRMCSPRRTGLCSTQAWPELKTSKPGRSTGARARCG